VRLTEKSLYLRAVDEAVAETSCEKAWEAAVDDRGAKDPEEPSGEYPEGLSADG
jgi:hypothetical protein